MRWLAIFLYVYVLIVVMGLIRTFAPRIDWLVLWPLLALLTVLSTLVHELGHAVMALRSGGRVEKIMVFPFELRFAPLRLGMAGPRPKVAGGDVAGFVAYRPGPGFTSRDEMIVAAAGPAAELLLALVAFAASLWLVQHAEVAAWPAVTVHSPDGLLPPDSVVQEALHRLDRRNFEQGVAAGLSALAALALGGALVNLIPFRGSDGETIWRAFRRGRRP